MRCPRGPDLHMDWEKKKGKLYTYFTFGVCCSEVELDCLTGEYRVRATATAAASIWKRTALLTTF